MRPPRSPQWRMALAYGGLILAVMAAATLLLVLLDRGASAGRVLLIMATATAAALGLSTLLAAAIAQRGARPLRQLTAAARRLAQGDLDHTVPGGLAPETRELAQALNAMTVSLKRILTDYASERDKLSAILATMNDGVALLDEQGGIILVNPAASEFLGFPAGVQEGQRFIEIVRDHELSALVSQCREAGGPRSLELQLAPERRHLSVIAAPLSLQGQECVLLVLHDLTQARRVETTRREFLANVSHELRTPLASIKASAETLVEGAKDDPAASRQFLDRISLNVDRMSLLVEELLDLSRLESGEVKLNLSGVDVHKGIAEALETHGERANSLGVELRADPTGPLPLALADGPRLRQALSNLVENAVKFTPAGGRVSIGARSRRGWLEISVADLGIGMSPEDVPHVFERFYKVDRPFNQSGVGLGLAIAKHIVQSHGGRIWVESRMGEGSVFTFTVPAVKDGSGGQAG